MYDGVEIIVQKVIHTEDYRLRLISLRVRPGAGLGRVGRMGGRAMTGVGGHHRYWGPRLCCS